MTIFTKSFTHQTFLEYLLHIRIMLIPEEEKKWREEIRKERYKEEWTPQGEQGLTEYKTSTQIKIYK